ncbi:MAG: OmpA family protein [Rhodospirillaceae bacterium]|nr:OmpA family protein [Rhodospirillaceae bacterium]
MTEIENQETEPEKPAKPNAAWMVTFTDLVSLMLTFFVLLFSMSNVKMDEWEAMIDTLTQTLNPAKLTTVAAATSKFNVGTIFRKRAINLDYLSTVLEESMMQDPLLSQSQLMKLDDRLVIALPGDLLFDAGRAVMTDGAKSALFTLGSVLRNIGNQIGVNGHTDPRPPASGGDFTSNWELSLARAAAVANTIRRSGYTEEIYAFGYAASRYNQLPKIEEEKRLQLARRVDIVVFPTVGGD